MTQPFAKPSVTVGAPWWRERTMWLVVLGPATVVVAALATAVIAIRGAEPVLQDAQQATAGTARDGVSPDTPAQAGRNHAATPRSEP